MVRSYGHSFNIPFIITRGNNVYGEFQYPDKLIPKFVNHILKGEKLPVHGRGKSRRILFTHRTSAPLYRPPFALEFWVRSIPSGLMMNSAYILR
jgi:NAD dependent epimerase/dehydratase family